MVSHYWSGNLHLHYAFNCLIIKEHSRMTPSLPFHSGFRTWLTWDFQYTLFVLNKLNLIFVTSWEAKRLIFCLLYCQKKTAAYMVIFLQKTLFLPWLTHVNHAWLLWTTGNFKRICETEIGIMSQCCLDKNVKSAGPPYFANVAIKINAKVISTRSLHINCWATWY